MFRRFSLSSPIDCHQNQNQNHNHNIKIHSKSKMQPHELMIHDGDLDESELPSPPSDKAWVKDHDTNVWALMPVPTKANTAIAAPGFVVPRWMNQKDELGEEKNELSDRQNSNMVDEEDWEMISDHEDDELYHYSSKTSKGSNIAQSEDSVTNSSFVSICAPNMNSSQSITSSSGNPTKTLFVPSGESSIRSFNSTLLRDVATLAVNSVKAVSSLNNDLSGAEDISTLASFPSIRTTSVGGSNTIDGSNCSNRKETNCSSQHSCIEAYVEHIVLPSDTLQGICLSYKIGASKLRQVNHFTGNSLLGAPKKLVIPLTRRNVAVGIKQQDQNSKEYKICYIISECSQNLRKTDAQDILEKVNWNVEQAIKEANSYIIKHENNMKSKGGDGLSFQIAIEGNVAFPTKFIRSVFSSNKQKLDINHSLDLRSTNEPKHS